MKKQRGGYYFLMARGWYIIYMYVCVASGFVCNFAIFMHRFNRARLEKPQQCLLHGNFSRWIQFRKHQTIYSSKVWRHGGQHYFIHPHSSILLLIFFRASFFSDTRNSNSGKEEERSKRVAKYSPFFLQNVPYIFFGYFLRMRTYERHGALIVICCLVCILFFSKRYEDVTVIAIKTARRNVFQLFFCIPGKD